MKEYTYQLEHSWEKQRRPVGTEHRHHHHHRQRFSADDADGSSMSETTSESGVSDLETSMTDFRCTCCPYGYHLDTDFMKFLDDMYGPNVLRTLQKIERKRHDVRSRLTNEQQPVHAIPISTAGRNSSTLDNEIIRETILELDRIVEKDIKDLAAECHRHSGNQSQTMHCGHTQQQRSHSVDSRRHLRPPPRPPKSYSTSSAARTTEEHRLLERRMQTEKTITTRTHSAPRLNLTTGETMSSLRKIDMTSGGPIAVLHKIPPPPPPYSRSSSSSSLSTETTLRVSSPEPYDRPNEPLKPLYITEIIVPPKPIMRVHEPIKTTVITITDKTEIERRNRDIERLEFERKTLLSEKEILLKEIDRYKHQSIPPIPEKKTTSITILTNHEQIHSHQKPLTREVAVQHIVEEEEQPPPLPPKQRQQRDVAINHRTEYDEDEQKQSELVQRKLEEIKNFYTERIHILEEKIHEQEKDIQRLSEPKKQRHVNTQCQPTMQDRALVTDTFRSVRDVALTCHLQPAVVAHRDVSLQCNTDEFIQKRDVSMEALPDIPMTRDVSIGVAIDVTPDKHFRDVGTHVNFDYKPEIRQRDVATMFAPEPIEKTDRASNTRSIQTKDFGAFANTIEPPKPPPRPVTRPVATDTFNLITQKDTASGPNEPTQNHDTSTDTTSLISLHDRASGLDIPPELLSRHVSTDTRTLISLRDNFSTTIPLTPTIHIDAQTQSTSAIQHDASSNTLALAEQRHIGVQAIQEPPLVKNNTTSTELDIFHQLGSLRHNLTNTDIKRSTDRSTFTERRQSHDLAVNTEPKIMYSKNVGDFDVRINDERSEEYTWNAIYRPPRRFESGFQTDLFDTKRRVGYLDQELKIDDEDAIEEQRQEVITFRLPLESRTTEEIYETIITTETKQNNREIEEIRRENKQENYDTTFRKSETTEWVRSLGSAFDNKQQKQRSKTPEELIEESYEVVSTVTRPPDGDFLMTSTSPRSIIIEKSADFSTTKFQSSEDDSSYCEEWTVTEAKRKRDGQTVQTIIDRDGHHRYNIDADRTSASSSHRSGIETHIEEIIPSTVHKTTLYESRRKLDQPMLGIYSKDNERQIEEKYEVTVSSNYDESGLKILSSKPMTSIDNEEFELDEEMYIACAIINESLYDKHADKMKVNNSLQLIQEEWFRISSEKESNLRLIEGFLNSIKENFSTFLLERIVNLQDANGNTALHYGVTNGHWNVVNVLLDTKVCDVCLQNHLGYTAVMMAAVIDISNDDQREVVRRLFRESGNVNVKTTDSNQTALMLAVKHGKTDLVELLLGNGAAVNLQDSEGTTALICAVEHGSLNIVKLLLGRVECDVDIMDNNGQTAISIATDKNRKNILVELYAKIKERKRHQSAFSSNSRTSNRSPRQLTRETTSPSSRRTRSGELNPIISTFRRYYSTK